jgi:acyl carrier protein
MKALRREYWVEEMDAFPKIKDVLMEILDVEEGRITPETYVIRELEAESIDLLELAVSLNTVFKREIIDDDIFLRKLRLYLEEAVQAGRNGSTCLAEKYPFLDQARIKEVLKDMGGGPVLKVKDLVSYIHYESQTI